MSVLWLSPLTDCNICHDDFGTKMFDAAIPSYRGQWGNICTACFIAEGCSLGTGKGQRYELQDIDIGRAWVKTGG